MENTELTQKELKKHIKLLSKQMREWNPGKDIPEEETAFLNKKTVTIDDFWAVRKIYALAGLNVTPPLFEKQEKS